MSTVQAFNTMMKSFLDELADVFPEEQQLKLYVDGFDSLVALNQRGPMDMFVEALSPHSALAMAKDPQLFETLDFPGIDFKKLWHADISDNTREAIWQYINLLLVLGTTVRAMPPAMLESIEAVAQNCAEQMQNGQFDMGALGGMLMNGGLANLAANLGGMPGMGGGGGADALSDALNALGAGPMTDATAAPKPGHRRMPRTHRPERRAPPPRK